MADATFQIEIDAITRGFQRAVGQAEDSVEKLNRGFRNAGRSSDRFSKETKQARDELGRFLPKAKQTETSLRNVGKASKIGGASLGAFTAALGPAAAGVAGLVVGFQAIQAAGRVFVREIGASVNAITELSGAVGALGVLGDASTARELLNLSNELGGSAVELADARYQAISAGVEEARVNDLVIASYKTSVGTRAELNDVISAGATLLEVYGASVRDASEVMDLLVTTERAARVTTGQLASSIGRLVGPAEAAGLSIQEMLTAVGTVSLVTGNANEAVTQARQLIQALATPTSEAAAILDEYGLAYGRAAIKQEGFEEIARRIYNTLIDQPELLKRVSGEQEGYNALLAIGRENGRSYNRIQEDIADSAGAACCCLRGTGEDACGVAP